MIRIFLKIRLRINFNYFKAFSEYKAQYYTDLLNGYVPIRGTGIRCNGRLDFSDPKSLIIGNNVYFDKNVNINSDAGVVIGDNSYIGANTNIYSTLNADLFLQEEKGVFIGQNVMIEPDCRIMPGTMIDNDVFIKSGTVVRGHIKKTKDKEKSTLDLSKKINQNVPQYLSASQKNEKLVFILSTGRSGSQTISALLNQHPDISCYHEARSQLIRISTEYAYGKKSREETKRLLNSLYNWAGVLPIHSVYGESNQKLSNLASILAELFPTAKFIWLIRDGKKVVKSTYARGWYGQEDASVQGWNKKGWNKYRLNGYKVGAFSEKEWLKMSTFDKNCWYWAYWNGKIQAELEQIENSRWMILKLEELREKTPELMDFLDLEPFRFQFIRSNKAPKRHSQKLNAPWTEEQKGSFDKFCKKTYSRFYE